MAKRAANVEKGRLPGIWIVYDAEGYAFSAHRHRNGGWAAVPCHATANRDARYFTADALARIAEKIRASKANIPADPRDNELTMIAI